jgi:hypothetical protein
MRSRMSFKEQWNEYRKREFHDFQPSLRFHYVDDPVALRTPVVGDAVEESRGTGDEAALGGTAVIRAPQKIVQQGLASATSDLEDCAAASLTWGGAS